MNATEFSAHVVADLGRSSLAVAAQQYVAKICNERRNVDVFDGFIGGIAGGEYSRKYSLPQRCYGLFLLFSEVTHRSRESLLQ